MPDISPASPISENFKSGDHPLEVASHSPWQGRRVALTGGTSGLGLALVEALSRRGAHVAFVAREESRVQAVAERIPGSFGIAGDVSEKSEIYPIALQINAALGGVDLLINNASSLGPTPLVPLADTECEDLELALATNLLAPFRLTKALLGALSATARDGRKAIVVNISSDAAVNAYATWGAYGASKAALLHLSRIWQEELKEIGIQVLSIDPGDMDTPLHHIAIPDADPESLKKPETSAAEILARLEVELQAQGARA